MICIPVLEISLEAAIEAMKEAALEGDVIELRLDAMRSPDVEALLAARPNKPLIATVRSADEGGVWPFEPQQKVELLAKAAELGADYVDIELRQGPEIIKQLAERKGRASLIVSWHYLLDTPDLRTLRRRLREAFAAGADVCKLVTLARTSEDNRRLLQVVDEASRRGQKVIGFCTGDLGRFSRVATLFMGGLLTFAYLRPSVAVAPGMLSVEEMKRYLAEFHYEQPGRPCSSCAGRQ